MACVYQPETENYVWDASEGIHFTSKLIPPDSYNSLNQPFKSRTGDPVSYPPESKTVESEYDELTPPKLCPLRKKTTYKSYDIDGEEVECEQEVSRWAEEEFLPCIKDRCGFYNKICL